MVSIIHVLLWLYARRDGIWVDTLWYELLWNAHTMLSALVLLHSAFRLYARANKTIVTFLVRMGEASFAIYLIHPLVLAVYRRFRYHIPIDSFTYVVWIAGGLVIALFLTWLMVAFGFRYVPFVRIFLGSVPRSYLPAAGKDSSKVQPRRANI